MKGKRAYGSPLPLPEKSAGKRRCLVNSTPHSTRVPDLAHPSEIDTHHDPPSDNVPEVETSSRPAANLNCPTPNTGPHDQSNHDTDQPPGTGTSQALVLVGTPPVIKQEDGPVDMTSALLRVRAPGTLLYDWPAYSRGVTEGTTTLSDRYIAWRLLLITVPPRLVCSSSGPLHNNQRHQLSVRCSLSFLSRHRDSHLHFPRP